MADLASRGGPCGVDPFGGQPRLNAQGVFSGRLLTAGQPGGNVWLGDAEMLSQPRDPAVPGAAELRELRNEARHERGVGAFGHGGYS